MTGSFTGEFNHQGQTIRQFMSCSCDHCGGRWSELFEVINGEERKITQILSVDVHEESDVILICNGFGMPVAEIPDPAALAGQTLGEWDG